MKPKVFIVDYSSQADYKVCFVKYRNDQKNEEIIEGGLLVKSKGQANIKVYMTKYKNEADILILPDNFPKGR